MELRTDKPSDPPILWSIPFTLLLITLMLAAADTLLPFVPLNQSPQTWTWLASTLVATIVTSLVTETLTKDGRRGLISMVVGAAVFSLIYKNVTDIFSRTVVDVVESAIPNPLLGKAIYTSVLTVVPGTLAGTVMGGIAGLIPGRKPKDARERMVMSTTMPAPNIAEVPVAFEILCHTCGRTSPYESRFCPFCGVELTRREVPVIKYCRYCGSRIKHLGQFCPDCGREIDQVLKPQIYFFE